MKQTVVPELETSFNALTAEDLNRSHDRLRVVDARKKGRKSMLLWLLVGPGVLAMLGENDGPSMLSYAATGATYGIGFFLPFIAVTFLDPVLEVTKRPTACDLGERRDGA